MAEFKKLSEVEVIAEPTESANVLIEEDGVIKKAPKTAVGGSGDVSWNDLTDKPFYEEVTTTIFIPETEGVVITVDHYIEYDSSVIPSWNEGDTLTIKWDGVEYEAVCQYNSNIDENAYFFNVDGMYLAFRQYDCITSSGTHNLKEGDTHTYSVYKKESAIKQIDEKFVPGLPILIKVYQEAITNSVVEYRCDLTEGEIEQLMAQGRFLYVAIYFNNGNDWIMNTSLGFFYCDCYSYPDDDRVIFTSPDGIRKIVFSSLGTVTYIQS